MNTIAFLFVMKVINAIVWYTILAIIGVFTLVVLSMSIYKAFKERAEREEMRKKIKEKLED